MPETGQETKETSGGVDHNERPKTSLDEVCTCKETLDRLADLLLDADWDSPKSKANIDTAKEELRNTIKTLNKLQNSSSAKGDIGNCLANVRKAHIALTQATSLLKDPQLPNFINYPEYIDKCWEHIVLASDSISTKCP